MAITFYGMSTFEGPMLSIKSVNALSHYTDWTIAHVHAGALGWIGFMTFGMIYWLLPRLFQTPLWSQQTGQHALLARHDRHPAVRPADLHRGHDAGTHVARLRRDRRIGRIPDFVETVIVLMPMYWVRVVGGLLYLAGHRADGVYNAFKTWRKRPPVYEAARPRSARAGAEPTSTAPEPTQRIDGP